MVAGVTARRPACCDGALAKPSHNQLFIERTVATAMPTIPRFLLSARASYITGAETPVDGGLTARGGTKSIVDALRRPGR